MNESVRDIIKKIITGLVITLIAVIPMHIYYDGIYTLPLVLIGIAVTAVASRAYLLPFAFMKIEGIVKKSRVKTFRDVKLGSRRRGVSQLRVVVTVKTVQGRWFRKSFEFKSEADNLPVGTRIRFTILDERPVIIKNPNYK